MILKATILWFVIGILAVGNGVMREALLEPGLGPSLGLAASGLLLALLVLGVAYIGAPWYGRQSQATLLGLGVYRLVLTILFESGLGLILLEQSWEHVLRQYSLAGGNLWLLVLSAITVAPWLAGKMRGLN